MALQGFDHLYIETAHFAASVAFWHTLGLEWLGRAVTSGNRRVCGLPPEPEPGAGGDRVVIEAASLAEAVALVPARRRAAPA